MMSECCVGHASEQPPVLLDVAGVAQPQVRAQRLQRHRFAAQFALRLAKIVDVVSKDCILVFILNFIVV